MRVRFVRVRVWVRLRVRVRSKIYVAAGAGAAWLKLAFSMGAKAVLDHGEGAVLNNIFYPRNFINPITNRNFEFATGIWPSTRLFWY